MLLSKPSAKGMKNHENRIHPLRRVGPYMYSMVLLLVSLKVHSIYALTVISTPLHVEISTLVLYPKP